jgi:cell pole-organizing protein PopZ
MGDVSAEPSMEDILSSIKRIIAEEGDSASPVRPRRPARAPVAERQQALRDADDEVLELNERLPVDDLREREDEAMAEPIETILSARAAEASRGSLEALSKLVVKPEPAPEPPAGVETLEATVREMLRPMLREWLDRNLPSMVESMVQREIARITGSAL